MLNYFIAVTILCLVIYLQTIESSPTESSEGRPVMPSPESPTITYSQQQQPKGEYHTADDSLLTSHYTTTTSLHHHPQSHSNPHHNKLLPPPLKQPVPPSTPTVTPHKCNDNCTNINLLINSVRPFTTSVIDLVIC